MENIKNIRNFVIIAHIDHGKSTLADRLLEVTGTVEARRMRPQYLDQLELERERGITIKMAPVRMHWRPSRGLARIDADSRGLLHEDLTYKIRGALFTVYNALGPGHKEGVYQNALALEFEKINLSFEREKRIDVMYDAQKVGLYQPDFVIDGKVVVELKVLPFLGDPPKKQTQHYLRGSNYRLALLVNFGGKNLEIERIIYDSIRNDQRVDPRESASSEYILNLIDTPGHSDFAYEVSRALHAVEGAILLVDVTKGIQAQTLSNLHLAEKAGLKIIGAVNKIDLLQSRTDADGTRINADGEKVIKSLADLLGVSPSEIFRISGKTGEGVPDLLRAVIEKVPSPKGEGPETKALIFDSLYDEHKGILAFVRLFGGRIVPGEEIFLLASGARFKIKEVGAFLPHLKAVDSLSSGEIGYIATGLKETDLVRIGDTVAQGRDTEPLQGYREPAPVVFISFYPDGATEFDDLKSSLEKLKLNDPALYFEPEANEALGRGLKVGFLGQLHFEITASRLRDEFDLDFLTSFPSVAYRIREQDKEYVIKQAKDFPASPDRVFQPMIRLEILSPERYVSSIVGLKTLYSLTVAEIKNLGENFLLVGEMPLAELLRDFDDQLKSLTAGFASFSYELAGEAPAEVEKLEIIVAADVVEALTRIVPEKDLEREARTSVEKLKKLLPRMQFAQAIQARARGRIIARETIPALRKDVTGYLYGGDRSRKMKLWKKQKRGKERLKETGRVNLPVEVFREILKK
ncbi:MAG: elongation factor 4 [Candidatus Liptonbacteria bacterium GWB1_49_6]|uniref:Elongation factor 4 n=1 Tax=Candidatus Liptonbacteria bacterium GWB1_49_6 TaxID=1798644 RepID=A0A1G2C5T3_9BACT|nr:MAG: elongation factor 4 [Candidatus Liptonbacteria bacterium GWB1_49_6]